MIRQRLARSLLPFLLAISLSGCGLIYTHVTKPLGTNFTAQQIEAFDGVSLHGRSSSKHLSGARLQVEWGNRGIGQLAKEMGLHKIYFADIETLSVLGLWRQRWIHIYGE
ncbi:MAG: TRL domain-containing protein [Planctomycetota bacterium]|nr:TRL domain-containing protein [Planctomycetota bacterium]